MAGKRYTVVDVSNLAWRAYHTTGHLVGPDGQSTGVVYGVLRDIKFFMSEFAPCDMVFAFDAGGKKSVRHKVFPQYKNRRSRHLSTPEEEKTRANVREQIGRLRDTYLPRLGFRNIFWQEGYEADDVIASVVEMGIEMKDRAVIASADHDLYQLLDGQRVVMWNPIKKQFYTEKMFRDEFGVSPSQWHAVKAVAGCKTDDIPGARGVGEITVSQYVANRMKGTTKKYQTIEEWMRSDEYKRNLELTSIPFDGTETFTPESDAFSEKAWRQLMADLDIHSLDAARKK